MPNRDTNKPDGRIKIKDFLGYQPNLDPHDTPPGVAMIQTNACSMRPGELRVRLGFVVVQFEDPV